MSHTYGFSLSECFRRWRFNFRSSSLAYLAVFNFLYTGFVFILFIFLFLCAGFVHLHSSILGTSMVPSLNSQALLILNYTSIGYPTLDTHKANTGYPDTG